MKFPLSWLTKKVRKVSFYDGYGLKVIKKIKKGEKVIVFGGYVMTSSQFESLPTELKHYPFQIDNDLFFGLSKISEVEEADYLNHSCNPTCGFGGEITIVAMRDLNVGEEITIDYAMCITSGKIHSMKCLCKSKDCRKKITSNDWKNIELQKRYIGFFEPYIQEKINNL